MIFVSTLAFPAFKSGPFTLITLIPLMPLVALVSLGPYARFNEERASITEAYKSVQGAFSACIEIIARVYTP
tara:strand:- start:281 stop:496 length:216 start_codon:yes stop_codon:yes gene_type:complete